MADPLNGIPFFCIKTKEECSGRVTYINFKSTNLVEAPSKDFSESMIIKEVYPGNSKPELRIPMNVSPLYWKKEKEGNNHEAYVVNVYINDKFAIRQVLNSELIRNYLIVVTIPVIEDKFNDAKPQFRPQFVGHKLDFEQTMDTLKPLDEQCVEHSKELVNNRIILEKNNGDVDTKLKEDADITTHDLYYRPTSKILTCVIHTEKLPDSISFNDDRIIVSLEDKDLLDVYLPFHIDLKEPMKYKFDDKNCILRVVFKVL